jgi:hypothetical protein
VNTRKKTSICFIDILLGLLKSVSGIITSVNVEITGLVAIVEISLEIVLAAPDIVYYLVYRFFFSPQIIFVDHLDS